MESKKRKPIVAALLSVVAPGLGQIYNGQLIKGIVFIIIPYAITWYLIKEDTLQHFSELIIFLAVLVGMYFVIVADAFIVAHKRKEIILRPYNRWYIYVLIWILMCGIGPVTGDITPFSRTKAYKIPTGTMLPTLLVGDHIIVGLKYYNENIPKRGDVIVFKFPKNPERDFIKRIIGIGGDKIEIKDKKVYVNDIALEEPYIIHKDESIEDNRDNFGKITVPHGKFFVMGDNRDYSYDSRFWGFVDMNDIRGKALYIYWAEDKSRIGMEIK